MHLFTISRGIKEQVDIAIRDLQAQYFLNKNEGVDTWTQLQVRPIQLWEFVFAEEHLNTMLATINYRNNEDYCGKEKYFAILRKMLGAKKIPKLDYSYIPKKLINMKDVAFHHIGTKKDLFNENGTELL